MLPMVTVNEQSTMVPALSEAVHLTVVTPSGNVVSDEGEHLMSGALGKL